MREPDSLRSQVTHMPSAGGASMRKSRKRKQIEPQDKVPLSLTLSERDLILEYVYILDDDTERALKLAKLEDPNLVVYLTLIDLDVLAGAVAAEANHPKSKTLEKKFDTIYDKISDILDSYDDGLFNDSLPR